MLKNSLDLPAEEASLNKNLHIIKMFQKLILFQGKFHLFLAACFVLPFVVALVYGEKQEAMAFLISIIVCIIFAICYSHGIKSDLSKVYFKSRDSYLLVSSAWIAASLIGSLPFLISGLVDNFFVAFVESCSGFTTTGASIFRDVESLPHSILLYRCFSQWLGGMGIVVLFVALLPSLGAIGGSFAKTESTGPLGTKVNAKSSDSAMNLYFSYVLLTFILFLLLLVGKMSPFDALAHAFSTMGTGGFSTHNEGLAYFDSGFIYAVTGVFAMFSGINFAFFYDLLKGRFKTAFADEELRFYFILIAFSTVTMSIVLKANGTFSKIGTCIWSALYQTLNTISTTGFSTGDMSWPSYCVLLLVILMVFGGCSSATAGGLKLSRVLISFKIIRAVLRSRTHERIVEDIRFNGQLIPSTSLSYTYNYSTLFFVTIFLGTFVVGIFGGGDTEANFLTILSCISSLGPGLDGLGLMCEYHTNSNICLLVYNFMMIAGRLEITTLLILLSRHYWNPDRVYHLRIIK